MTVPFGNRTVGADSYDFLLYKIDPATSRYAPLSLVTGLTSPTFTPLTNLAVEQ